MPDSVRIETLSLRSAEHDGFCAICEGLIVKGDRIVPAQPYGMMHFECAIKEVTP